jgi:hypothetical protein
MVAEYTLGICSSDFTENYSGLDLLTALNMKTVGGTLLSMQMLGLSLPMQGKSLWL